MKSLIPWICVVSGLVCQQALANNAFTAYRLGQYNQSVELLLEKSGKDAIADYYLGRLYLYGYGQLKNTTLAMRYFLTSAEKGYLPSIQIMAKYSLKDKNLEQAIHWFKQAASKGDVDAKAFLAAAYLYGVGVKKNTDTAAYYYIDAAKNGNSIAQFAVAENFIDSRSASNKKLGLIWLKKAANNGNPKACEKLGRLYIEGKLVGQDKAKGRDLLTQAASQNYTPAMVVLGDLALEEHQYENAINWYQQAINKHNLTAYLNLAHAYLQEKNPIYDVNAGYLWTLKAAQEGLPEAKHELANLYRKGIGVTANEIIAKQWAEQAVIKGKENGQISPMAQAALWLSNDITDNLEKTSYQLGGIFTAWQNPTVLKNNIYNQPPHFEVLSRKDIFKPQFELIQPNDIPINEFYNILSSKNVTLPNNQWTYPLYPLNPFIEALERSNSLILSHSNLPAPYLDANYSQGSNNLQEKLIDIWTPDWQKKVNYMSVFNHMYFKALLGDPQSQFEIGQMFQYGLGVAQNDEASIIFYQNAAEQQHLGAEYNLGILYLEHAKNKNDYQIALNWLTDGAFKGNKECQYVLARILEEGKKGPDGTIYIPSNHEQALSMLYLSAANNYGAAEFELAEHLASSSNNELNSEVKNHKINLIRELYQGAVNNGIADAMLPLAYYNAMDNDTQRQAQAFAIAEEKAKIGDEKASLLLGMLYDRGIGVKSDLAKAIYWYQQSGINAVSSFILGTYTTEGKGLFKDHSKGTALLDLATKAQFSYANFNLAAMKQQLEQDFLSDLIVSYRLGNSRAGIALADYYLSEYNDKGSDKLNEAKQIYTSLAEKGDQYAQLKLAYIFEKGLGTLPNYSMAEHLYTSSAEQGNYVAQYLLGQFYQLGEGGEPDYNLARKWYEKAATHFSKASVALGFIDETVDDNYAHALNSYKIAASHGDIRGIYNLALMYEYGKGIPVDYTRAEYLFLQAASEGVSEAMNQLGYMYFYGLGQERNVTKAFDWYKKAADLGDTNAFYALGLFFETGIVNKLDFAEALKYYQAAATRGNEKAQLALARMYHYGVGVAKNSKISANIYQKLADKQNAYAQYQLGTYYLEGTAVARSLEKGRQLLKQASENGNLQARRILQRMEVQNQERISFIEPVLMNYAKKLSDQPAGLFYFDALNVLNRGDEVLSRMMLQRLVTKYPNFVPAKQTYEKLNESNRVV